jgi:hypothetical protein
MTQCALKGPPRALYIMRGRRLTLQDHGGAPEAKTVALQHIALGPS